MLIYATRGMVTDGQGATGLTVAARIPATQTDPNLDNKKCLGCEDDQSKVGFDDTDANVKQYNDTDVKIKTGGW